MTTHHAVKGLEPALFEQVKDALNPPRVGFFRALREQLLFGFVYLLIRLLHMTYRVEVIGEENREAAKKLHPKGAYIFACWHEYVLVAILLEKKHRHISLASPSFAGRLSGYILAKLGFIPIYGSQSRGEDDRGGKQARDAMLKAFTYGKSFAILPDATKGPRRIPKPGTVFLSKTAQVPILPFHCKADRFWRLNTWDQFFLPKPFAHIEVVYEKPLLVDANANGEIFELEQQKLVSALG